ncbi:hypothetical protein PCASD_26195 [Puccinia coronata f. sp. avenae]|uniref:Uncharacterized protein n=1 Tax=Puccinia coronata f. sp. avenae TaxID=200324 RepID=A0A2N5RUL9_9BASI|nr:hypothetical protein PCASD_26195 [Puccinia coronata f. sp. avenae]
MLPRSSARTTKYQHSIQQFRQTRLRTSVARRASDSLLLSALNEKNKSPPSLPTHSPALDHRDNPSLVNHDLQSSPSLPPHSPARHRDKPPLVSTNLPAFVDIDLPAFPPSPTSRPGRQPSPMSHSGPPSMPQYGFLPLGPPLSHDMNTASSENGWVDNSSQGQHHPGYYNSMLHIGDPSLGTPLPIDQPGTLAYQLMFPNAPPSPQAHPLPGWDQLNADAEKEWQAAQKGRPRRQYKKRATKDVTPSSTPASTTTAAPGPATTAAPPPTSSTTATPGSLSTTAAPVPASTTAALGANRSASMNPAPSVTPDHQPLADANAFAVPSADLEEESEPTAPRMSKETGRGPALKRPLEADVVAQLQTQSLDELRRLATTFVGNRCLSAELRLQLDQIHHDYQQQIYIMAITNKLNPQPALKYLGDKTRIRGPTSYNNFCLYNPEASPIHHDYSKTSDERAKLTGALWAKLNKKEKAKYRNPEFLETLPNPYIHIRQAAEAQAAAGQSNVDKDGVQLGPKSTRKQYTDLKPERWAKKTLLDMKRIGKAYQVEGFMVVVSKRGKRTMVTAGGSHLGQQYVDMTEMEKDTTGLVQDFCEFVNGQKVIKKLTGSDPPPVVKPKTQRKGRVVLEDGKYDKGSKRLNLADVREKLGAALVAATGGRYTRGWPGDTQEKLTKLGVQLRVRANDLNVTPNMFCGSLGKMWDLDIQYLQVAIGEGWFELTGPERTDGSVDVIGAVPDPVNNNRNNKNQSTAHAISVQTVNSNRNNIRGLKRGQENSVSGRAPKRICRTKVVQDADLSEDKVEDEEDDEDNDEDEEDNDEDEEDEEDEDKEDEDEEDEDEEDKDEEDEDKDDTEDTNESG